MHYNNNNFTRKKSCRQRFSRKTNVSLKFCVLNIQKKRKMMTETTIKSLSDLIIVKINFFSCYSARFSNVSTAQCKKILTCQLKCQPVKLHKLLEHFCSQPSILFSLNISLVEARAAVDLIHNFDLIKTKQGFNYVPHQSVAIFFFLVVNVFISLKLSFINFFSEGLQLYVFSRVTQCWYQINTNFLFYFMKIGNFWEKTSRFFVSQDFSFIFILISFKYFSQI